MLDMFHKCSPNHLLPNIDDPVAADIIIHYQQPPVRGVPLAYSVAVEQVERVGYATRAIGHLVL